MELASGEYIFILGNDDSLNPEYDIQALADLLKANDFPEIGYTNFIVAGLPEVHLRARRTGVIGSGAQLALETFLAFSYVAGIIIKTKTFKEYNTAQFDGSIYVQMYLATAIVADGGRMFTIVEPAVIKDITTETNAHRTSYLDRIPRKWKDYQILDGGLHSVIEVVVAGFSRAKALSQRRIYDIFKRIYTRTYPYWVVNYRRNQALPAALGLVHGLSPRRGSCYHQLSHINRLRIYFWYSIFSIAALLTPYRIFDLIARRGLNKVATKNQNRYLFGD
jgi:hypothetical protein